MSDHSTYMSCLRALADQTEALRRAAEAEDWGLLLEGLDKRQNLIVRIDEMPEEARKMTGDERAEAMRILEAMVERDREITQMITVAISSTRVAIDDLHLAQTTLNAYRRTTAVPPAQIAVGARFVDKQR